MRPVIHRGHGDGGVNHRRRRGRRLTLGLLTLRLLTLSLLTLTLLTLSLLSLLTLSQFTRLALLALLALDGGHRRLRQNCGQPFDHSPVHDVRVSRGVDNEEARGRGASQLKEACTHPGVELCGLGLEAVVLVATTDATDVRRDVEQYREVGRKPLGGPPRQLG